MYDSLIVVNHDVNELKFIFRTKFDIKILVNIIEMEIYHDKNIKKFMSLSKKKNYVEGMSNSKVVSILLTKSF